MKKSCYILLTSIVLLISCKPKTVANCSILKISKYEALVKTYPKSEILNIEYLSDSLKISGFIVKPKHIKEFEKLPLIIYNRGGNRDFGALEEFQLRYLKHLSSLGYVIMASQYRGNTYSKGIDEFGGNDINDIKCLITIAKTLNYVNSTNIGMIGYSRGGMMTYLLAKEPTDIKTFITVGAPTNLFLSSKNRPNLYTYVFKELIGDTVSNRNAFIDRSAVYWANNINKPLLILHGTKDEKVSIEHSKQLIDSLKKYSKTNVYYTFFEGGNHAISNFKTERNKAIEAWFRKHLKPN